MCVFICANPTVDQWLEVGVDYATRKSFQLCPVTADQALLNSEFDDEPEEELPLPLAPRFADRTPARWQYEHGDEVHFGIIVILIRRSASPPLRHKPLEFLAEAWRRLLLCFGWRG